MHVSQMQQINYCGKGCQEPPHQTVARVGAATLDLLTEQLGIGEGLEVFIFFIFSLFVCPLELRNVLRIS